MKLDIVDVPDRRMCRKEEGAIGQVNALALDPIPIEGDNFAEAASGSAWCSCRDWSCGGGIPKLGLLHHHGEGHVVGVADGRNRKRPRRRSVGETARRSQTGRVVTR